MHRPIITAMLLAAALLACGAADKDKAADKPKASTKEKDKDNKDKSKDDKKPACMHCGATCCLEPICVCEPGTKKKPKNEYETKCEPICVAGCGSKPWPFDWCHERAGCTSCCAEPCRCPGWVRNRKTLKKETVDEEVPIIKRKVAYVCDACAGCGPVACGTGSCCDERCATGHEGWWSRLTNGWKLW